jgi:hypothetical protein
MSIVGGLIKTGILAAIGKEHETKLDQIVAKFTEAKDAIVKKVGEVSGSIADMIFDGDRDTSVSKMEKWADDLKTPWEKLEEREWSKLHSVFDKNFSDSTGVLDRFGSVMHSTMSIADSTFMLLTKLVNDVLSLDWATFWESFGEKVDKSLTLVTKDLESFSGAYADFVKEVVESDDFTGTIDKRFKEALAGPMEFLDKVGTAISDFLDRWQTLTSITNAIQTVVDFFSDEDKAKVEKNLEGIGKQLEGIEDQAEGAMRESARSIGDVGAAIKDGAGSAVKGVVASTKQLGESVKEVTSKAVEGIAETANKAEAALHQTVAEAGGLGEVIKQGAGMAMDAVVDSIDRATESAKNFGKNLGNLDIFNRGATGANVPFIPSQAGNFDESFGRNASELEGRLEGVTINLKGIIRLMKIMSDIRLTPLEIEALSNQEKGKAISDWLDLTRAVTKVWQELAVSQDTETRKMLDKMMGTFIDFSNELVLQSLWPDMVNAMIGHTKRLADENIAATDEMLTNMQGQFQAYEKTGVRFDPFFKMDIKAGGDKVASDLDGVNKKVEEKISFFQSVIGGIENIEMLPEGLKNSLIELTKFFEESMGGVDKIVNMDVLKQIQDGFKRLAEDAENLIPTIKGLQAVWDTYQDALLLVQAKTNTLGMAYDALPDKLAATEEAIVNVELAVLSLGGVAELNAAQLENYKNRMAELQKELGANRFAKKGREAFDMVANTITSSIDQMVVGVLRGTQTMDEAFKNLARNILISLSSKALTGAISGLFGMLGNSLFPGSQNQGVGGFIQSLGGGGGGQQASGPFAGLIAQGIAGFGSASGAPGTTGGGGPFAGLIAQGVAGFATASAGGGPLHAGQTSLVGEKGPELFKPNVGGTIIPNKFLQSMSESKVEINIINKGSSKIETQETQEGMQRRIDIMVSDSLQRDLRSGGKGSQAISSAFNLSRAGMAR